MTQIFFDESHHKRGEFTLGAFVVSGDDLSDRINAAIVRVGLTPGVDEYKSRRPHAAEPRWRDLRRELYALVGGCRIGIMVAPHSDRARLGTHALAALAHILRENDIDKPVAAYFDEGLFGSDAQLERAGLEAGLPQSVRLEVECDSRSVSGIQLADLVAHACSIALLGRMGLIDKMVGGSDGEEGDMPLAFEMWVRLRWNFFLRTITEPERMEAAHAGMMDSRGGLYVAPGCNSAVFEMAQERFGQTWLGCIH